MAYDDGQSDGLSPQAAFGLLAVVAVLGVGFMVFSAILDHKSADPLLDSNDLSAHTSPSVMETRDAWKGKTPPPAVDVQAVPVGPERPVLKIKPYQDPEAQGEQKPAAAPPTTGPGK